MNRTLAQVEHEVVEARRAQLVQLRLELGRRGEVELADRHDAHDVTLGVHVDAGTARSSDFGGFGGHERHLEGRHVRVTRSPVAPAVSRRLPRVHVRCRRRSHGPRRSRARNTSAAATPRRNLRAGPVSMAVVARCHRRRARGPARSPAGRGLRMKTSTAMSGSMWWSLRNASTSRPVCSTTAAMRSSFIVRLKAAAHVDDRVAVAVLDEAALGLEQRIAQHDDDVRVGDRRVRLRRAAAGVVAQQPYERVADRLRCLTAVDWRLPDSPRGQAFLVSTRDR